MNKQYSVVAIAFVLLALATITRPLPPTNTSTTASLAPIYVPQSLTDYEVPCGGGTHLISFDYFPAHGDTTYEMHLMAEGGTYGGSVTLSLPWGYEDSVYVPALSGSNPYTVTVTTPPYTGINPVRVFVYGTGEVCQRQKHDERATVTPLIVHALNIKAGH